MEKSKKGSVFRTWVVSYLAVLLLPLIFSYIVYFYAYSIIKSNTATINEVALRQTEESVDRIFSELRSTGRQILTDEKVASLIWAPPPLTPVKLQKIGMLQSELSKKSAFGSYISEIYVYFYNSRVAASTTGICRQATFEKNLGEKFRMDIGEFERLGAQGGSRVTVKLLEDPAKPDGGTEKLAVFVSNAVQKETPGVTCMFILDAQRIRSLLENYSTGDPKTPQSVWAVAEDGSFLSPQRNASIPREVMDYCGKEDGIYYTVIDGKKSVLMSHSSGLTGWKLISAVSLENYRAQLSSIRNAYIVFLAFCLAVGVGISFYFTKRNYTPLQRVTELFLSRLEGEKRGGGDEFAFLERELAGLLKENRAYEQQIGHQKKDLRQMWLGRMLRGRVSSDQTFRTVCGDYEIRFSGGPFFVVGVTLQDCGNLISKEEGTEEETLAMVNFMVSSVLEELFRPEYSAYVCSYGNALYAVAELRSREEAEGGLPHATKERARELCLKAGEFIWQRFHISVRCYISGVYAGREGIHQAYEEANWGMEQMESFQIAADIATEEDVRHQAFREQEADRPEAGLRELCMAVASGDAEEAWRMYLEILRESIADLDQSFFYVRLYTFRILDQVSKNMLQGAGESGGTARELRAARNMDGLKRLVLRRFAEIAEQAVLSQENSGMPLQIAGVVEYIDGHFSDPDLTVASLAERFSISQSYLLRMFKKSVHAGILEYICQRRVNEAKRLLKSGSATVSEIARQVGYANSLALIRAFKKLEDITPATYRKIV